MLKMQREITRFIEFDVMHNYTMIIVDAKLRDVDNYVLVQIINLNMNLFSQKVLHVEMSNKPVMHLSVSNRHR